MKMTCDKCDAQEMIPAAAMRIIDIAKVMPTFALEHSRDHNSAIVTTHCACGATHPFSRDSEAEVTGPLFLVWLLTHREHEGD
jgi:hypothetical protein